MADFKTHITTSSVLGVAYGAAAYFLFGVTPSTCIVAGGLCSISGMLPDLDSDSGVPVRETISVVAAAIPMLMMNRMQRMGWTEEMMACAAIVVYCVLRFGVAEIFKRYTVHRGMWHSIPACAIAGLLAFLVVSSEDFNMRIYKTMGVVLGFMSHLVLDEIWSFQVGIGGVRVKKSFGTAIKFFSDSLWANVSTYGKLVFLVLLAMGDPALMERYDLGDHQAPQIARGLLDRVFGRIERAAARLEQGQGWRLVPRDQPTPKDAVASPSAPPANALTPPTVMPASAQEAIPMTPPRQATLPTFKPK